MADTTLLEAVESRGPYAVWDLMDDDGVMCRYGDTVTLKTYAHVKMCQDFSPS